MSLLAHSTGAANGDFARSYRKWLDDTIQHEIREARRIARDTGMSYSEALRSLGKTVMPL